MVRANEMRVLAIGMDAAEPLLVRELIADGQMPNLASLLERGRWAEVDARADYGSDSVWPTFLTGADPVQHQQYYLWRWDPIAMTCVKSGTTRAFWEDAVAAGEAIGLLDVPRISADPGTNGFEVSEWGAHHESDFQMRAQPAWARELVESTPKHAFHDLRETPGRFDDPATREELATVCIGSARARADLAVRLMNQRQTTITIVNFAEIHRASHALWRTVEPEHPVYADLEPDTGLGGADLRDLYRAVDDAAGRIIDAVGPETAVVAFSLHGMQAAIGTPDLLEELLVELGFATPAGFGELSWRDRALSLFAAAKRRAPAPLRRLYHRSAGAKLQHRLAEPTVIPAYHWPETRAFSLPTEQHGYVRVNLAGREAKGIVPESEYDATCDELEAMLTGLRSGDGEPLVAGVLRPARETGSPPELVPDLIVHWTDAVSVEKVRAVSGPVTVDAETLRTDRLGNHTPLGFCIVDQRLGEGLGDRIAGSDLHTLLLGARTEAGTPA